ncbi:hypothetical protein I5M32_03940 [Pedobacter sp. SD-b]|uniref:Outer membrane protein beta-barrel domain-containing protein n=1 Tax=Pedobacter segetis TaxID=2793069 RepID=A0ABS1BGV5_9SPHI|nr:hypothetical protein [Pedobacter segetis]MBK0382102.1 hypothetical protein [Pedobacter segetis]
MKKLFTTILMTLIFGIFLTFAQDKIYKKGGEILETKVTEIGKTEIKYKIFSNLNGPIYTIEKEQVIKIVYENGNTEIYEGSGNISADVDQKRAQNVYVELGAQGLLFTANYDTRFNKKRNGIGGRVGLGGFGGGGTGLFTVPVSLNYLLGNGKNFFEIGLGATYAKLSANDDFLFGDGGTTVFGTMAFMYRLQPIKSGFSFRGGLTPIFNSNGFFPYYGLSLGYTF